MKINIVEINDLHFGIGATERERKELDMFLNFISTNKVDMIVFNGDYFDHKMLLGDPAVLIGTEFFNKVLSIAQEKEIKIRMVEGTLSHDRFQPRIFENFIYHKTDKEDNDKKKVDYKYFETVGTENVLGLNILYVPEEYPVNIDEYYDSYKKSQYNLMFVHGTWDFINFGSTIDNNRNDINTAPVFKYDEWKYALEHGVSISGHIHGRHVFKTKDGLKVVYPGSFTSWSYDQISERGFSYIEIDNETNEYSVKFIDNKESPTFANLNVSDLQIDNNSSAEDFIKKIKEQKEKVDHLKVDLSSLPESTKKILAEYYKINKEIDIKKEETASLFTKDEQSEDFKKYDYLLKDSLTLEQSIIKYGKEDLNIDLTEDQVKESLKEA